MVIKLAKENEITTIRVPKTVKEELKDVALEKEPMHLTIQRLIKENEDLKKSNAKNDELLELYKLRYSNYGNLCVQSNFLQGVLENDYDSYNYYLDSYNKLNHVLLNESPKDVKYDELKNALKECLDEIGDDELRDVVEFAKISCYDEFGLLSKLEDEMFED